jgi:hypothetical protein
VPRFEVDGGAVRDGPNPPTSPMQVIFAVYDLPEWEPHTGHDPLTVSRISGRS